MLPRFFAQGGRRLYGVVCRPAPPRRARAGVVLCAPFADEAVHAHRVLFETSRRLAEAGVAALLFDYVGTGDSEGAFEDGSLGDYAENIVGAAAHLTVEAGLAGCGLLGLRLGANLAMRAAGLRPDLTPLVLWAPIADLSRYFRAFLRLRLLTELTTLGRPTTTVPVLEARLREGESVDVLGYPVSATMARDFLDGSGAAEVPPATRPTLLVEIDPAEATGRPEAPDATPHPVPPAIGPTTRRVADEPFWERARALPRDALLRVTLDWLQATLPV